MARFSRRGYRSRSRTRSRRGHIGRLRSKFGRGRSKRRIRSYTVSRGGIRL